MGQKRHFKGNNRSDDKKRRREAEEKWKSSRGDDRNSFVQVSTNTKFEAFYKAQNFISPGDDWDNFMTCLRSSLPASFRLNPYYEFFEVLKKQLHEIVSNSLQINNEDVKPITQLDWYPSGCAYKLGVDRRQIRKTETLEPLHKWMMMHTDCGNITRQEAVSMIPPLALDVHPHHKCIDMCAAPGSKTSQLLEIIDQSKNKSSSEQGVVVANDSDTDRAYMLVHQCRRLNSPFLIVTTHKGQEFPSLGIENNKDGYFDRVLCDVPCSGDGTIRKSPHIWSKWNVGGGISLHPLQLMIAKRGFDLLKTDGLMVYSTCSMSPYENEAVVAELLRHSRGCLELVDASKEYLPKFKCRPGLNNWLVFDDKTKQNDNKNDSNSTDSNTKINENAIEHCISLGFIHYPNHSDVPDVFPDRRRMRASLFPPSVEEQNWMHLERCMRCVPHDEDTGGFFVATLRKIIPVIKSNPIVISSLSTTSTLENSLGDNEKILDQNIVKSEEEILINATVTEAMDISTNDMIDDTDDKNNTTTIQTDIKETDIKESNTNSKPKHNSNKGLMELKVWDENSFKKMSDFYGFDTTLTVDSFFVREDNIDGEHTLRSKTVFYLPLSVRSLMASDRDERLKIVTAGIKVFERSKITGDCDYRLVQEGVSVIEPFVSIDRKLNVTNQDFCNLLGGGLVSFTTLSPRTVQAILSKKVGTLICIYDWTPDDSLNNGHLQHQEFNDSKNTISVSHRFLAICWRCPGRAINVMCGKTDIQSMKHQLEALGALRPKIQAQRLGGSSSTPVAEIVNIDNDSNNNDYNNK